MSLTLRYTRTAVALHWLIAVLMIGNVALALCADYLPEAQIRPAIDTHRSIGITVLGLALLRLLWRSTHRPPALPRDCARSARVAARVLHALLYLLMVALPLSGWLLDSAWRNAATHPMTLFGLVPWPRIGWVMNQDPGLKALLHDRFGTLHVWCGYVLYACVALHIGVALKHQWIDRKPALQRML